MIPRRVAFLGVAALLLAGAGIAAAATREPAVEAVTATAEVPAPTTTTAPATTTTEPSPTSTSTTSTPTTVGPTTTTARRATTTTTRRPLTTSAPPQPTSTTAPAPTPTCTPAQIQVTATASRPSYGPGENAEVTTVLRNRSSTPCSYNGYTVEFTFMDSAGEAFAGGSIVADTFRAVPLAAGATLSHTESWRHIFQPAGPHTGTAVWRFAGTRYEATAGFRLT